MSPQSHWDQFALHYCPLSSRAVQAVALSQLDGLRKDLLRTARDRIDFVLYNKATLSLPKATLCHAVRYLLANGSLLRSSFGTCRMSSRTLWPSLTRAHQMRASLTSPQTLTGLKAQPPPHSRLHSALWRPLRRSRPSTHCTGKPLSPKPTNTPPRAFSPSATLDLPGLTGDCW